MDDEEFLRAQRDGLLMQAAAIERRLGIQKTACCPQCQTKFIVASKHHIGKSFQVGACRARRPSKRIVSPVGIE